MDSPIADELLGTLSSDVPLWIEGTLTPGLSAILLAAFGIVVGFVAYKLIKRALNKA